MSTGIDFIGAYGTPGRRLELVVAQSNLASLIKEPVGLQDTYIIFSNLGAIRNARITDW